MMVKVFLKETSQQLIYMDVTNTYVKGPFFCIYLKEENRVCKFPIRDIFEVVEDYK